MLKVSVIVFSVICSSGYLFLSKYIRTKFSLHYHDGYHILYKSLIAGFILFLTSIFLFMVTWPLTSKSDLIHWAITSVFGEVEHQSLQIYIVCINTMAISFLMFNYLNIRILLNYKNKVLKAIFEQEVHDSKPVGAAIVLRENGPDKKVLHKDSSRRLTNQELSQIFHNCVFSHYLLNEQNNIVATSAVSWVLKKQVLITLSNNKCYVGIVSKIQMPEGVARQGITIYPVCSGFRDKEELRFEITTIYKETVHIFSEQDSSTIENMDTVSRQELAETVRAYEMSFPLDQITSLAIFDINKYQSFKKDEEDLKRRKSSHSEAAIPEQ